MLNFQMPPLSLAKTCQLIFPQTWLNAKVGYFMVIGYFMCGRINLTAGGKILDIIGNFQNTNG